MPVAPPEPRGCRGPLPSGAQLLADALVERATGPTESCAASALRSAAPRRVARDGGRGAGRGRRDGRGGLRARRRARSTCAIGPHRRFAWVQGDLAQFKAIKDALGGTINDVVLTSWPARCGRYLRRHGARRRLELKAMVPMSVRADAERGALGNRVAAMYAPLPVGLTGPGRALRDRARRDGGAQGVRPGGRRAGDHRLADSAPPTVLAQAARLQSRQRFFNLA